MNPDYMSVTYGAGGSVRENRTCELSSFIKNNLKIEPLAHLTGVASTKEDIDKILSNLSQNKISNILALRGDLPKDGKTCGDFPYAANLIEYIKNKGNFNIAAACYPEKHTEAADLKTDIMHLKEKVDCGVSHLITQLFFDNDVFYDFSDKILAAGINVPVCAGIMPIVNKNQIYKMSVMCGATIPKKHMKMLEKFGDDTQAVRDAGIIYAMEQIVDLIANGVRGIHIYTMNNPYVARRIMLYLNNLLSEK